MLSRWHVKVWLIGAVSGLVLALSFFFSGGSVLAAGPHLSISPTTTQLTGGCTSSPGITFTGKGFMFTVGNKTNFAQIVVSPGKGLSYEPYFAVDQHGKFSSQEPICGLVANKTYSITVYDDDYVVGSKAIKGNTVHLHTQ